MSLLSRRLAEIFRPAPGRATLEWRREKRLAMQRAKRLAAKHGVEIEIDRDDGTPAWWVRHPHWLDRADDPMSGNQFCSTAEEVLQAVQIYVEALAAEGVTP